MPDDHVSTHQAEDDVRNESILIWVNGRLLPRAEATVSVYDSGFMLGDGVWEGMRLYDGRWAFLDEHLDRLFEAALAIDLDIGRTKAEVAQALLDTQAANGMQTDAHARLMVTRGVKSRPFQLPRRPWRSSWSIRARTPPVPSASPPCRTCEGCR
jgi:branched-chain amino acid aminotransferase